MSKLIYACIRDPHRTSITRDQLVDLSRRLLPDNMSPRPPRIEISDGIAYGVLNPTEGLVALGHSVALGSLTHPGSWHQPQGERPEGTYALIRADHRHVEVLSDVVASRTIWYYFDEDILLASTSQRAIVHLLRRFEFNEEAVPWFLSTGVLGPESGWDRRIGRLAGDSSLMLDREAWTLNLRKGEVRFLPASRGRDEHRALLAEALSSAVEPFRSEGEKWVLPLSGGYDSRALLFLLRSRGSIPTITWGESAALHERDNDAFIARQLAEAAGVPHTYHTLDASSEPWETVLDRFLICGEGRVDHISGYVDGFLTWKTLFEEGIQGIIRGDEGFGWIPVHSPSSVRASVNLTRWNDFANLRNIEEFGFPEQEMPAGLQRRHDETLEIYRDRLYHEFRIPAVLAALNDLKAPYVEIANPLLSRGVIELVRTLPDSLRTDKRLFKDIVRPMAPGIGFARSPAIAAPRDLLSSERVVRILKGEITSARGQAVLKGLGGYIADRMNVVAEGGEARSGSRMRNALQGLLPAGVKHRIRSAMPQKMDFNVLGFRAFIACRMHQILSDDATPDR